MRNKIQEKIDDLKKINVLYTILIIVFFSLTTIHFQISNNDSKQVIILDNFTETLDVIEKNCGSTHISIPYGKSEYHVFTEEIRKGPDEYVHIPIHDCLIGDKK